jgi:hypothetical protein
LGMSTNDQVVQRPQVVCAFPWQSLKIASAFSMATFFGIHSSLYIIFWLKITPRTWSPFSESNPVGICTLIDLCAVWVKPSFWQPLALTLCCTWSTCGYNGSQTELRHGVHPVPLVSCGNVHGK